MTELRKKLRSVSSKNQSLQDILRSCGDAKEILSVEPHEGGIHNAKLTLLLKNGTKRVHFYDRVQLKEAIPDGFISSGDIELDIQILNLAYGCDFTGDDVVMECGKYAAKPTSIGYFSESTGVQGSGLAANEVSFTTFVDINIANDWGMVLGVRVRTIDADGEFVEKIYQSTRLYRPDGYNDAARWGGNTLAPVIAELFDDLVEEPIELQSQRVDYNAAGVVADNFICKLINHGDKAVDISMILYEVAGEMEVAYRGYSLLPNVRLSAEGKTLPYCPITDTVRLTRSDIINFEEGIWDGSSWYPHDTYFGELLSLNGSDKDSWFAGKFTYEPVESDQRPLDPYIDSALGGLANTVRAFISMELWNDAFISGAKTPSTLSSYHPDKTLFLIKNCLSTPVEINHASFAKPLQLTGSIEKTHPDEALIFAGYWGEQYWIQDSGVEFIIGDMRIDIQSLDEKNWGGVIRAMHEQYPGVIQWVDASLLSEIANGDKYAYFRNLSDRPLTITITGMVSDVIQPIFLFTLKPKGTPGVMHTDDVLIAGSNPMDEIVELRINDNVIIGNNYEMSGTSLFINDGAVWMPATPFYQQLEVELNTGVSKIYGLPGGVIPRNYYQAQ